MCIVIMLTPTGNGNISTLSTDELVIYIFKLIVNDEQSCFLHHIYLKQLCTSWLKLSRLDVNGYISEYKYPK